MIVDISGNEWIVRFKGKKITFRTYRTFSKLIENIKTAGEATIQFELASVQEIDPSSLGMFLQFFHALNPEHHKVAFLNAAPPVQKKLHDLFDLMDPSQDLNAIVANYKEQPKQLFEKVLRARSMKIRRQSEQEDKAQSPIVRTLPTDMEQTKQRIASFLKFQPAPVQPAHLPERSL